MLRLRGEAGQGSLREGRWGLAGTSDERSKFQKQKMGFQAPLEGKRCQKGRNELDVELEDEMSREGAIGRKGGTSQVSPPWIWSAPLQLAVPPISADDCNTTEFSGAASRAKAQIVHKPSRNAQILGSSSVSSRVERDPSINLPPPIRSNSTPRRKQQPTSRSPCASRPVFVRGRAGRCQLRNETAAPADRRGEGFPWSLVARRSNGSSLAQTAGRLAVVFCSVILPLLSTARER
jgi:hypothetical protein